MQTGPESSTEKPKSAGKGKARARSPFKSQVKKEEASNEEVQTIVDLVSPRSKPFFEYSVSTCGGDDDDDEVRTEVDDDDDRMSIVSGVSSTVTEPLDGLTFDHDEPESKPSLR